MRSQEFISEVPLTDYQPLGDFEKQQGGFRHSVDKKLVTNPVTISKVYKFFERTGYDIRIFPVQVKGGSRYLETGEVNVDQLVKIVGQGNAQRILGGQGPDNITIVFTNNTGAERIPLTPWMMAHRMGHVIRIGGARSAFVNATKHFWSGVDAILKEYYGLSIVRGSMDLSIDDLPLYRAFIDAIGTMRSARNRSILRPGEFFYEMFAQYLNTGTVRFNPAPAVIQGRRQAWGNSQVLARIKPKQQQEATWALETLGRDMELLFNDIMASALGRIYVM
jgi:hypothetical protein